MDQSPDIQAQQTPMPSSPDVQAQTPTAEQSQAPGQLPEAQAFHGSMMGNIGRSILSALGGSSNTTYQVDPNSGAVTQQTAPATPGSQWKTILAGALTGLAAGAGVHGPGGAGESASKGFAAGAGMVQQKQEQAKEQAQSQSQEIHQAKMNQASFVMNQQQMAANALSLAGKRVQLSENFANASNALQEQIKAAPNAQYQGFFKSEQDVAKAVQSNPQLAKDHTAGTQIIHPTMGTDADGNPTVEGFEVWNVPKQWMDSPTDHDVTYTESSVDQATGKEKFVNHIIPKGSIDNKFAIQLGQKGISGAITPKDEASNDVKEAIQDSKSQTTLLQQQMKGVEAAVKASQAHQPLSPEQSSATADMIGNYQLDAKTARYMFKEHPEIIAQLQAKYPGFSEMNYEAGQSTLKSFGSGGTNNKQKVSAEASMQHASHLFQLISKLPIGADANVINRVVASTARELGMSDITDADTLAEAVSSEMSKSLVGGVADKDTIAKMRANLEPGHRNWKQIQGAVKVLANANAQKLDGLAQTLEQVPGIEKNPYAPKLSTNTLQAMKTLGINDNPFDFQARAQASQQASQPAAKAPAVGTVQQGYKFLGGNPANPKAWQQVTQ